MRQLGSGNRAHNLRLHPTQGSVALPRPSLSATLLRSSAVSPCAGEPPAVIRHKNYGEDMKDLAPEITRQRLLIEGHYSIEIDQATVEDYLLSVARHLALRTYGTPIVHAPGGLGKDDNEGFDAFVPLIDSGISLYVWTSVRLFAAVLFTCKEFDTDRAVAYTLEYFGSGDGEHESF